MPKENHMPIANFRTALIATILFTFTTSSYSYAEHISFHETSEAGISYELVIESDTTDVMKPLPVTINISDPNGEPVTGAQISCSLVMPAMAMPSNKPPIKESEKPGQYKGLFLLTMGGLWQVELLSTFMTGEQDAVVIPIPSVISEGGEDSADSKLENLFQEGKATNN